MPDTVVSIYQATLTFAVAAIALLASPGPATLALAASGAAYGMKRSVAFFLGITLGLVVAMTVVGTGLYVVLHSFPVVATVLTGISILYILSLAYRIGTAPPIKDEQAVVSPGWGAGFVLGAANIKAYAAFAALLGSFTLGTAPAWEQAAKASICLLVCVVFDFLWLLVGSKLRKLFIHPTWSRVLNVSFALLMIATVAWSFTLTQ
ncbi:lysine transporter LysE [Pseudomonas azotoformans]|uniref:Lysine transporter LysE n=1 Tax=Pseudomonas azotoformans TaxID=47878 RepID=A0A1V2JMT9_PSEAZ|nr:LysE family translocator [Pseudomonas azotoformans]OIN44368.1 lysine transporter LysE [Pseudomonas azotoformans]ONH42854.1 lysine transporter LysE [Pseudomonas azotoformans]ONH46728.1 lysine transporter LysE [Pseudomonas azotoformans]SDO86489.1 Threonine/homoserine/homoserine lactone efflux protein [Pseudomonas azotoformans]